MEKSTIQNFVHFCFNYPHNFVEEAFKDSRFTSHLKAKFNSCYDRFGSRAVVPSFYAELDLENQQTLDKYILSLYENSDR